MFGNRAEICGATIVVALAAFFFYFCFQIQEPMTGDPLGPRWLPTALSSTILLLGLVQLGIAVREGASEASGDALADARPRPGSRTVVAASALTVGFVLALVVLGYALATALFASIAYYLYGHRSVPMAACSGVAMAAGFYLLFTFGLQTNLPSGYFWGGI